MNRKPFQGASLLLEPDLRKSYEFDLQGLMAKQWLDWLKEAGS
jgi:hypothetical protein